MASTDLAININLSSSESESDEECVPAVFDNPCSSSSVAFSSKLKEKANTDGKADSSLSGTDQQNRVRLSSSLEPGIDLSKLTYLNIYPNEDPKKKVVKIVTPELDSKNVICQPGFEKQLTLPPYVESRRKIKRERLKEREKTKGPGWFNMPAPEMTEERKNDLAVLQMRGSLDPKRFYKRGDEKFAPKYFSIGTVIEHAVDFYHARIPKKQRKQTLVEELLADAEYTKYQKRKYAEAVKSMPKTNFSAKKKEKKKSKLKELGKPANKKGKPTNRKGKPASKMSKQSS